MVLAAATQNDTGSLEHATFLPHSKVNRLYWDRGRLLS